MPPPPSSRPEAPLSRRDKLVAVLLGAVLIAIILAIFRLGLRYLYGWSF
ncbi:hypothetical protein [Rhizosaccharibacter radicis]|uniref:Uncharacterized protein n=1 Tax=Rhizosaccharibacter radicis TaxID=2782605 RepID=A0ABT1W0N6_9PROT|nr:hypothetical protein [Acetobacteraceae bacterium KSS12]